MKFFKGVIAIFAHYRLDYTIKFLSTIGIDLYMLDSLADIAEAFIKNENIEYSNNYFSEKLLQKYFTNYESQIKSDPEKKSNFLMILDKFIDKQSAIAYLIKESFIS